MEGGCCCYCFGYEGSASDCGGIAFSQHSNLSSRQVGEKTTTDSQPCLQRKSKLLQALQYNKICGKHQTQLLNQDCERSQFHFIISVQGHIQKHLQRSRAGEEILSGCNQYIMKYFWKNHTVLRKTVQMLNLSAVFFKNRQAFEALMFIESWNHRIMWRRNGKSSAKMDARSSDHSMGNLTVLT